MTRTLKGVTFTRHLMGLTILGRSLGVRTQTKTTPPLTRMSQSQVRGADSVISKDCPSFLLDSTVHVHVGDCLDVF